MLPEAENELRRHDTDGSDSEVLNEVWGFDKKLLLIIALVELVLLIGVLLYYLIDPQGFFDLLGLMSNGSCRRSAWWQVWRC